MLDVIGIFSDARTFRFMMLNVVQTCTKRRRPDQLKVKQEPTLFGRKASGRASAMA